MKIQCDVCEKSEASVLCCADEAALCWGCDERVHAANKLAGKHQRVPLFTPSSSPTAAAADAGGTQMPTCDICQEKAGYFFCLEDRALLCRNCDVAIHMASAHGSSHRRFLITGVRVALEHYLSNDNSNSNSNSNSSNSNGNNSNHLISQESSCLISDKKTSLRAEEGDGLRTQWNWNEVFDNVEFSQCYGMSKPGSSS